MSKISAMSIIDDTCDRPWTTAVDPFAITDHIYYVGNAWVGAYLIDTEDGLILLDTTTAETAHMVLDNIYRLGYDPHNIKKILLSHAHVDHDGAAKFFQELTGGALYLSETDDLFRRTKAAEYVGLELRFKAYDYDVDVHYDDSNPIELGCVKIRTRLTPGHTPGTTSFFIEAPEKDGRKLVAAMHGGVGVLTMSDKAFEISGLPPMLRRQFIQDCEDMKKEKVDICLPSHPAHYNLFSRRDRGFAEGNPFVDESGWSEFLTNRSRFAIEMEKN